MERKNIKKIVMMMILSILVLLTACQPGFEEIRLESGKIAFISSRNEHLELFMADHTGDSVKKMMESDAQIVGIAISPDLRYVILEEAERTGNNLKEGGLYIYDLEQRKKRLIDKSGVFPSWSPDGNKFIYVKRTEDFKRLFILADPRLEKKEVLFENTEYPIPWGLSWSPDGSELLFYQPYLYHSVQDVDTLYRYTITEKRYKEIKLNRTYNLYNAAWSPVEHVIAAGIYDPELAKYTIVLINPDSGEVRKLTTIENNLYGNLSWSPDGNYLVFSAFNPSKSIFDKPWPWGKRNLEVYVYDIKNDRIRNISNSPLTDYMPQWIP